MLLLLPGFLVGFAFNKDFFPISGLMTEDSFDQLQMGCDPVRAGLAQCHNLFRDHDVVCISLLRVEIARMPEKKRLLNPDAED
jgi:hypothetical protein